MIWAYQQQLDPLHGSVLWSPLWSTLLAALPVVVLFWLLVPRRWLAPKAGAAGAVAAILIAVIVYRMPPDMAVWSFISGAAFGLLPVGWTIFNAMLLYNITVETGQFSVVRRSVTTRVHGIDAGEIRGGALPCPGAIDRGAVNLQTSDARALAGGIQLYFILQRQGPGDQRSGNDGAVATHRKAAIDGPSLASCFLHDVETSQQRHAITVNVKDAASGPARPGVALAVVSFAEFQSHPIPPVGHRQCVGKMPPTFASVKRHVRRNGVALLGGIRRADQGVSAQEIGIGLPLLTGGILPR